MNMKGNTIFLFLWLCMIPLASAQVDARMFRYPDVSDSRITFVYAGDIWVAPKEGGLAHHLSSPPGEESFPRFSPDGTHIAFTGNYDGNMDVYVIPTLGGSARRITFHPLTDRVIDWKPDGRAILFASTRESGRTRFNKIFSIPAEGGFAEKLPIAYGEFGDLSSDGRLLAFTPQTRAGRTWKRYRGGGAPEIWIFDLETKTAENISSSDAVDDHPMWHGDTLYFLSDRGKNQRHNIWKYHSETEEITQITDFKDVDVTYPAIGPNDIVFQAGGRLYLLDLATERTKEVAIDLVTDRATLKPKRVNVGRRIDNAGISPSGKRAFFEARGEIFTVPEEHGIVLNMSRSSGSAERSPSWSPDGKHIAYWSDKTGEYELYLLPADGSAPARKLTDLGPGFRYTPFWSPDSKKLAFIDQTNTISLLEIEGGKITRVDRCAFLSHPALASFGISWSATGDWLAYEKVVGNTHTAIFLYHLETGKTHQVTSGYFNDSNPVFDPEGNYLYYFSDRSLTPVYGDQDETWIYPNSTRIVAVPLHRDVPSPLAPRNDTETTVQEKTDKKPGAKSGEEGKTPPANDKAEAQPEKLKIDLTGFEHRLVVLPPPPGNYSGLAALQGQVIYHQRPNTGSADRKSPVMSYDLEKRTPAPIVENAGGFAVASGGKKMLVSAQGAFYIIDIRPGQKLTKKLRTQEMEAVIDPRAEWRQMFNDIWRKYRDFFYDPNMHGLDWEGMRSRYGKLLNDAVTRWDANFVYGELVAELNSSHTYVGRGDLEQSLRDTFGMLGIDWELDQGAYRIARIIDGGVWDSEARSPLLRPGVDISEGDYILAVNGVPLETGKEPWAAFQGLGGKTVMLTVNGSPQWEGSREVLADTLTSEVALRELEWVEKNRRRVDEASNGRIGYIYMPDTALNGQTNLVKQFYGQLDKKGFIIDERFNNGGQLADRFLELLKRPVVHYIAWRDSQAVPQPLHANPSPKALLINGWSVSGGDALPYTFKNQQAGKIIGIRTAGGLIGPAIVHVLVDGGYHTVPEGRIFGTDGRWFPEGHGVEPDIRVMDDPAQLAAGIDPQLERAIEEVEKMIESAPFKHAASPKFENRTAKKK
jgi:tricorn protease